ncbi:hypothetical protein SAMN06298216_1195 [Spirosomataceae bacterium TFI 002]|nr:hypothetical protein SAMN06298216_1195 [Spirosomataceae bacterium TFI 002]
MPNKHLILVFLFVILKGFGQEVYYDIPFDDSWNVEDSALALESKKGFITVKSKSKIYAIEFKLNNDNYASLNHLARRENDSNQFLPKQLPKLIPFPKREKNQCDLFISSITIDLKEKIQYRHSPNFSYYDKGKRTYPLELYSRMVPIPKIINNTNSLGIYLSKVLNNKGYYNFQNENYSPEKSNTRFIDITVNKLKVNVVNRKSGNYSIYAPPSSDGLINAEVEVKIKLIDQYSDTLYLESRINKSNDFYYREHKEMEECLAQAFEQSLEYSVANFITSEEVKPFIDKARAEKVSLITANFSSNYEKLEKNQIEEVVIGLTGKNTSQTGTIISSDGLVITAFVKDDEIENLKYHTISGTKGRVLKVGDSKKYGLTLFRMENTSKTKGIKLATNTLEVLDEILIFSATDIPNNIYGFSSGIISGKRKIDPLNYYWQTDASVTPSSIGAPVWNLNGQLSGIIIDKNDNENYLGISFILPAKMVNKAFSFEKINENK